MTSCSPSSVDPLVPRDAFAIRDADARYASAQPPDPYVVLDDLMAVVEALCPLWPERSPMTQTPHLRL